MKERRTLTEGLSTGDVVLSDRERDFVLGKIPSNASMPSSTAPSPPPESPTSATKDSAPKGTPKILPQIASRVLITTRATPEVASALKRASLQRQLDGLEPFYVQEILDDAIGDWLRKNGYFD